MFETNAPPPIPTNNIITISSPTGDGPAARNIVSRMVPTASPADPILFKASAPPLCGHQAQSIASLSRLQGSMKAAIAPLANTSVRYELASSAGDLSEFDDQLFPFAIRHSPRQLDYSAYGNGHSQGGLTRERTSRLASSASAAAAIRPGSTPTSSPTSWSSARVSPA